MAAYGLGSLLNSLRQPNDALRKEIVSLVDPGKLAEVFRRSARRRLWPMRPDALSIFL